MPSVNWRLCGGCTQQMLPVVVSCGSSASAEPAGVGADTGFDVCRPSA
jgi:hypothetical protein